MSACVCVCVYVCVGVVYCIMCDVCAELKTVSLTAELDDEKPNGSSLDLLMTTPTKEDGEGGRGFGGKDISRRFERQSWRERHAEERRRLKLRFEVHVHAHCTCTMYIGELACNKRSSTHRASSQGWAPCVLLLLFISGFFLLLSFYLLVCYTHLFPRTCTCILKLKVVVLIVCMCIVCVYTAKERRVRASHQRTRR